LTALISALSKIEAFGEEPLPVPMHSPQIPRRISWDRTQASAVKSRQLRPTVKTKNDMGIAGAFAWRY